MIDQSERACLAIADISGYTGYLTGVELDHAQDVLMDLLGTVVEPFRPDFKLAKLEGDAVFLYALDDEIDGSVLLDRIEACYFGFQRRLLTIVQASACECDACVRIPDLDLKVVVHHGSIIRHEVLGSQELVGSDVIVVHRLLKNRIVDDLRIPAYALLTDACLEVTGLDPAVLDMVRYEDDFDGVGTVGGWVHDLGKAWRGARERERVRVDPDDAVRVFEGFVPGVPVSVMWEWITSAAKKRLWETSFDDVIEYPGEGGRRGPGTETHCVHGDDLIKNSVLDWRPPHYVTNEGAFPDGTPYIVTDEVEPADGGTTVRKSLRPTGEDTREALEVAIEAMAPAIEGWIRTLERVAREEYESREPIPEAELPQASESVRLASAMRSTESST